MLHHFEKDILYFVTGSLLKRQQVAYYQDQKLGRKVSQRNILLLSVELCVQSILLPKDVYANRLLKMLKSIELLNCEFVTKKTAFSCELQYSFF